MNEPFKPMFVPSGQLLAQMAAADRMMNEFLAKLEADGFVHEPGTLRWIKRDSEGNIIAEVTP